MNVIYTSSTHRQYLQHDRGPAAAGDVSPGLVGDLAKALLLPVDARRVLAVSSRHPGPLPLLRLSLVALMLLLLSLMMVVVVVFVLLLLMLLLVQHREGATQAKGDENTQQP